MFVVESRLNSTATTSPASQLQHHQQKQHTKTSTIKFRKSLQQPELNVFETVQRHSLVADASSFDKSIILLSAVARSRDSTPLRNKQLQQQSHLLQKTSENTLQQISTTLKDNVIFENETRTKKKSSITKNLPISKSSLNFFYPVTNIISCIATSNCFNDLSIKQKKQHFLQKNFEDFKTNIFGNNNKEIFLTIKNNYCLSTKQQEKQQQQISQKNCILQSIKSIKINNQKSCSSKKNKTTINSNDKQQQIYVQNNNLKKYKITNYNVSYNSNTIPNLTTITQIQQQNRRKYLESPISDQFSLTTNNKLKYSKSCEDIVKINLTTIVETVLRQQFAATSKSLNSLLDEDGINFEESKSFYATKATTQQLRKISVQSFESKNDFSAKKTYSNNCCNCLNNNILCNITKKFFYNNNKKKNFYQVAKSSKSLNSLLDLPTCSDCARNCKNCKARLTQKLSLSDLSHFGKMCTNCVKLSEKNRKDFLGQKCQNTLLCRTLKTISEDMNLLVRNITKEAKALVQAEM